MECHVSCHGHNPGCPDTQNIAFQAHWTTLLQTHSPDRQYICRASCRVTGAAHGVLAPRACLVRYTHCNFGTFVSHGGHSTKHVTPFQGCDTSPTCSHWHSPQPISLTEMSHVPPLGAAQGVLTPKVNIPINQADENMMGQRLFRALLSRALPDG